MLELVLIGLLAAVAVGQSIWTFTLKVDLASAHRNIGNLEANRWANAKRDLRKKKALMEAVSPEEMIIVEGNRCGAKCNGKGFCVCGAYSGPERA